MSDKSGNIHGAVNASILGLVIFLAAALYILGQAMSGEPTALTQSVNGALVVDNSHP